jgi:hypothetical protein
MMVTVSSLRVCSDVRWRLWALYNHYAERRVLYLTLSIVFTFEVIKI